MISARFQIALPEETYMHDLSTDYPAAQFRLLSSLETEHETIELGEVIAEDPSRVSEAFANHPSIVEHKQLVQTDRRSMARYRTAERGIHAFLDEFPTPPEFPIVVESGSFEFSLTTTREAFERLQDGMDEAGLWYELLSITPAEDSEELLTTRQREALTAALRLGYFEVPRACNLVDVAETLDVDKSTASELLRRGQGRLVVWFLGGATGSHLNER